MKNDNIIANTYQDIKVLSDIKINGKERPWKDKKMFSSLLEDSYKRLSEHERALAKAIERDKKCVEIIGDVKACNRLDEEIMVRGRDAEYWIKRHVRVNGCATYLIFKVVPDGSKKLHAAHFCQVRLCAMCGWRREIKIKSQLTQVFDEVEVEGYRFIMLTLTCKNVAGDELSQTLDNMFSAFNKMFQLKKVKNSISGHFRALEITHDTNRKITSKMYKEKKSYYDSKGLKVGDINPNFNMYHPHFHVMIAVKSKYFRKAENYIKQAEWQAMWKQSLKVDYDPVVHVQVVKNSKGKSIKEAAKYTVKETDYIVKQDKHLTDETVRVLDKALRNRRLVAYGGIMKTIHKRLNLEEDVTADVNINEDEETIKEESWILQEYQWNLGFKNYVMVESGGNANEPKGTI